MNYQLAQLNIGTIRGPIDSEIMAGFVARLDEINALADGTPGFVWRLQTEEGNATALRPFGDDRILVNMSVWESIDALHQYVYRSTHSELLRQRREWFTTMTTPILVLWWIDAGHIPDVEEAKQKLEYLEKHGPTPLAFTFKQRFTVDEMVASIETNVSAGNSV